MSNISLHFYFLLTLSLALIGLALWLITKYQQSSALRYYGGFLAGLSLIALAQSVLYLNISSQSLLFFSRLGYVFGALTFSMLLMFSFYFLVPSKKITSSSKLLWIVPVIFFATLALFSPNFLKSVSQVGNGIKESTGMVYFIFPAFVAIYAIWSIINLIQKLPYLQPGQKRDMNIFLFILVTATLLGVVFDVILPATGKPRIPIGIYSSTLLFGISAYIVLKK